ncbi:YcnI family protein [Microbacterium sp. EYE_5]|uniref:DUF1775 domain-containing protein n=1 Tax=unclassified Microbacterium TaxID=2609290 RepID=UPI002005A224|nr:MULTISPECIES: DUF1775 domain-containing protein [unclassified Microbacterium]MCK6081384.1 YcnI family protein [Microbacterium sp. EYE_382]MCK6086654.1 YcnI family protein [Microbacterium sp. EYE_384]MCK6123848.1 YcnI family protein [Microbacterium sp. EYE_80]MCK6126757.1 YcnI family protein [Microbacterium sp. EYE_79]MCK6142339.1 YcnI family protein [Microbacterium sp. EYE_39]
MTTRAPRRSALALTGAAIGGALVLAAPLAASAHVHVHADGAAAGATSRLDFTFSHGCDGAATTALVFDIPDAVDNATPIVDGAWTIDRELGENGVPTRITYTAVTPVEDGLSATVAFDALFSSDAGGTDVAFPVVQQCGTAETAWSEIAEDGQDPDELESPAPLVAVGAASETGSSDHGEDHGDAAADAEPAAATAPAADATATWLAGGALVLGAAALVVALLNRRRV